MQPALDLVLSLARVPLTPAQLEHAERVVQGAVEWDLFFATVARGNVEPVALSNLRQVAGIPVEVLKRAGAMEHAAKVGALANTLVVIGLVDRLRTAGIKAAILKGPAVGIVAYGDASLRTFGDADILVKRNDLYRARDILLHSGYTRDYEETAEPRLISDGHALEFSGPAMKVELHRDLLSRHLRFRTDVDGMWRRVSSVEFGDSRIQVLAVPDMFLYLCAHGAKHEWERLRWVCDIAQLAGRMSEEEAQEVVALARKSGSVRIVRLAMHVAQELFGKLSSSMDAALESDPRETNALVGHAMYRLGLSERETRAEHWAARLDPRLQPLVYWARSRERRRDQIACLARVLFVPTGNDSGPAMTRWISRPLRLAARAARHALGARPYSA